MTLHLGLTGGIGSGKSTVAALLQAQGAGVVDADAISRASTAPGGSAIPGIRQHFGNTYITATGALDRVRMSTLCFGDPQARAQLEAIVHPLVQQALQEQADALVHSGKTLIAWDIPLLVESAHWRKHLHRILVVDCSAATQLQRVLLRSQQQGQPRQASEVQRIIDAQARREHRLAAADWIVCNEDVSMGQLARLVQDVLVEVRAAQSHPQTGLSSGL